MAGGLGELPLVLLTRGLKPPDSTSAFEQLWAELQRQEAQLSPNAVHVIAARSGHGIQRDQQTLVSRAIREVVTSTRTGNLLRPCPQLFPGKGADCAP